MSFFESIQGICFPYQRSWTKDPLFLLNTIFMDGPTGKIVLVKKSVLEYLMIIAKFLIQNSYQKIFLNLILQCSSFWWSQYLYLWLQFKLVVVKQRWIFFQNFQISYKVLMSFFPPLGWGGFKFENWWMWSNYMNLYTRIIAISL